MQISLHWGESRIPVQVTERKTVVSKHTGRSLEILSGEVVAQGEQTRQVLVNLIREAGEAGVRSSDPRGTPGKTWRVRERSSSYRSGPQPTVYVCQLELEEFERIVAERLIIGSLSLTPYTYEERAEEQGLDISANVTASAEEGKALRELLRQRGYYEVRRVGVSDEPRRMRFGRTLWSRSEGKEKYSLRLIEESWDKVSGRKGLDFYPELTNIRSDLAQEIGLLQGMADLFVRKGIITRDELDGVEQQAIDGAWDRAFGFFEMDDIDAM